MGGRGEPKWMANAPKSKALHPNGNRSMEGLVTAVEWKAVARGCIYQGKALLHMQVFRVKAISLHDHHTTINYTLHCILHSELSIKIDYIIDCIILDFILEIMQGLKKFCYNFNPL